MIFLRTSDRIYVYRAIIFIFAICEHSHGVKIIDKNSHKVMCSEIPKIVLSEVLGAAYNSRYMSVTAPNDPNPDEGKFKRGVGGLESFYAQNNFAEVSSNKPAWPWDNNEAVGLTDENKRPKRDVEKIPPWKCEAKLHWIDLGPDYFPQYLRSVECESRPCWFGRYRCKPRSFTIKLLKRKRDRCVVAKIGTSLGIEGLPVDLRELWVWEERAVNFCCECSL